MILQKLGGDYQPVLNEPENLLSICNLDEAHWMATSAPTDSFTCDPVFLNYMDTDQNGRIRSSEVKAAQQWLFQMLTDCSHLGEKTPVLNLDAIDVSHDQGKGLKKAAERILVNLGIQGGREITLDQVRNRQKILASGLCNGDGVIPAKSIEDPELFSFISDIIRVGGGIKDASGELGVDNKILDAFLAKARKYIEWHDKGVEKNQEDETSIKVWGKATDEAYSIIESLQNKIDEFFILCQFLLINPQVKALIGINEKKLEEVDLNNVTILNTLMKSSPLASPNSNEVLPIDEHINPFYRGKMLLFNEVVLKRTKSTGSNDELSRKEWEELKVLFKPYADWLAEKEELFIQSIKIDTLQYYLNSNLPDKLRKLIEQDRVVAHELHHVENVEKLILYQQWFLEFINNFVSFTRLYDPLVPSLIQVGTLVLNGRCFDLTVKVRDRAQHKQIVQQSNICVMYLSLTRKEDTNNLTMQVAAAVTSGSMTQLFIGKAGVFFTPDGYEWDAIVVDFVANPVSLVEAVRKPFTQLGEFISKQTERFSLARFQDIETGLEKSISSIEQSISSDDHKKSESKKALTGNFREIMVSGSIAFAAVGSSFAFITKTLQNVSFLDMASVVCGLVFIVFVPIIIIAIIKLSRRNLSIFLEACGWAVNGQMRLTYEMGLLFTREPLLSESFQRKQGDLIWGLLQGRRIKIRVWLKRTLIIISSVLIGLCLVLLMSRKLKLSEWISQLFSSLT